MNTFARYLDRWMNEEVNFGGELMSRAEVFRWFEREGYPRRAAELWLIGNSRANGAAV